MVDDLEETMANKEPAPFVNRFVVSGFAFGLVRVAVGERSGGRLKSVDNTLSSVVWAEGVVTMRSAFVLSVEDARALARGLAECANRTQGGQDRGSTR